ncbi:MAG: hypothetical protein HUU29_06210 [Planctomycetaceae bacterium]|nr:hypothetical protein [Planctomycetaceae bacterium]
MKTIVALLVSTLAVSLSAQVFPPDRSCPDVDKKIRTLEKELEASNPPDNPQPTEDPEEQPQPPVQDPPEQPDKPSQPQVESEQERQQRIRVAFESYMSVKGMGDERNRVRSDDELKQCTRKLLRDTGDYFWAKLFFNLGDFKEAAKRLDKYRVPDVDRFKLDCSLPHQTLLGDLQKGQSHLELYQSKFLEEFNLSARSYELLNKDFEDYRKKNEALYWKKLETLASQSPFNQKANEDVANRKKEFTQWLDASPKAWEEVYNAYQAMAKAPHDINMVRAFFATYYKHQKTLPLYLLERQVSRFYVEQYPDEPAMFLFTAYAGGNAGGLLNKNDALGLAGLYMQTCEFAKAKQMMETAQKMYEKARDESPGGPAAMKEIRYMERRIEEVDIDAVKAQFELAYLEPVK